MFLVRTNIIRAQSVATSHTVPAFNGTPQSFHITFKGQGPLGAHVAIDAASSEVDSTGHWSLGIPVDSLNKIKGVFDLCLVKDTNKACTLVHANGYDTLELVPLHFIEKLVVDKVSMNVDSLNPDSNKAAILPKSKLLDDGKVSSKRTVIVRGKHVAKVLGQERMTVQQIRRLPGLAEPNVIRAVQSLPGVVASSDFSTKMYVRGCVSD